MAHHLSRLSLIYLVLGAAHAAAGLTLAVLLRGATFGLGPEGDTFAQAMLTLGSQLLLFTGVLAMAGGILLKRRTPYGRMAGLTAAFFLLLAVPLGTLAGSYGIWVLFQDEVEVYFRGRPTGPRAS